jgi:plastocyanin domain-containing protein
MRTLTLAVLLILTGCKKDEPVAPAPLAAKPQPVIATGQRVEMAVTADGFVPANVAVKMGQPVTLVITRKTDETCATEILIEDTTINVPLPLDKPVEVAWTPTKTGKVKYGCAMDKMVGGLLLVE